MFPNNNFRGLAVLPYPEHVKELIEEVNRKNRKIYPNDKVHVYRGQEVVLDFDQ